jgi:hypothetical protein
MSLFASFIVTEEQRARFRADPDYYFKFRKVFEDGGNSIHESTLRGTEMQRGGQAMFRASMESKLSSRPDLVSKIIPTFSPGCRRLTPGVGFLEALQAPNVTVHHDSIASITPTGIALATGQDIHLDVLVCATGFHVSAPPNFPITGPGSLSLAQRWSPLPESYLSMMVDGFPNLLMLFGPNSAIGFGSLTKILEAEVDYAVCCVRKLQRDDYASLEPLPQRVRDFQRYVGAYFKGTVYTEDCRSWYRSDGGKGDFVVGLWPGSTLHALEALRTPRWEDFRYELVTPSPDEGGQDDDEEENALRWLGNGWSVTQDKGRDPSWYIHPLFVEVPVALKPEENDKYNLRPWSY